MKMGISFLPTPQEWLIIDADWLDDIQYKRTLYAEARDQIWVQAPGSTPAQNEILDSIVDTLGTYHPGKVERTPRGLRIVDLGDTGLIDPGLPPLLQASWLVQEDLCLMEADTEGDWRLTAASVAFPSRWDLPSKLGDTLDGIHVPVPGYAESLSRSVDRFFDKLKPGRIALRANWSLMDTPELYQPITARPSERALNVDDAPQVVLRAERQTLCRFPVTGGILFTIRTFRDQLAECASDPALARSLADDLRTMPEALAAYKAIPELREPVLEWLDGVAAQG